jgi:hypothetical protein
MQTQRQWMFRLQAGALQQFRLQLIHQEIIILALIHENVQFFLRFGDECASVVLFPIRLVAADVIAESFFTPGTIEW